MSPLILPPLIQPDCTGTAGVISATLERKKPIWENMSFVGAEGGFLMICLGGFFISNSIFHSQRNLLMLYVLLPMGFVILLSGIFWATYCHANENKEMFNHGLRQHLASQDLPLATVDRPDFYPPAYEESLGAEKQSCSAARGFLGFPPPLYTVTSVELEDENDPQPEAPPPYQEIIASGGVTPKVQDAEGPSPVLKAGPALQHSEFASC